MRIGITGYAESGKDVASDHLEEEFGFVRINMSDALDKYLQILDPYVVASLGSTSYIRYAALRQHMSLTEAKKIPEVRRLFQKFGTDVGRAIDPEMWVTQLELEASKHQMVVTTGIRYVEEVAPLDVLLHINRPGYGPLNDHSSEDLQHIFDLADHRIDNDTTIADLQAKVQAWLIEVMS